MEEAWTIEFNCDFERSFRKWHKRHPESCDQATIRIHCYVEKWLNNPLLARGFNLPGWIHPEGHGILAVEPAGRSNLAEVRLYFWPDPSTRELWLIRVGDKPNQYADIAYCHEWLSRHHHGHEDEDT